MQGNGKGTHGDWTTRGQEHKKWAWLRSEVMSGYQTVVLNCAPPPVQNPGGQSSPSEQSGQQLLKRTSEVQMPKNHTEGGGKS